MIIVVLFLFFFAQVFNFHMITKILFVIGGFPILMLIIGFYVDKFLSPFWIFSFFVHIVIGAISFAFLEILVGFISDLKSHNNKKH
jgi:hypothetical protein